MTPDVLLALAWWVLDRSDMGLEGVWPRASALLGRQALESALDIYWERTMPGMVHATRATQLACLPQFLKDVVVADGVRVAWSALSRACHHHPYELAPTAAELQIWLGRVDSLVASLN
jgi:hypothetical protein